MQYIKKITIVVFMLRDKIGKKRGEGKSPPKFYCVEIVTVPP